MDEYLDESVIDMYNDQLIVEAMEQMENLAQNEPQEYGVYEATLFDEI